MTAAARSLWRRAVAAASVCAAAVALAGCSAGAAASASAPTSAATSSTAAPSATARTTAPTTPPTTSAAPPFIARVQWVKASGGRSLHVVPTAAGRAAQGPADDAEAWSEVVALAPDAEQPGMHAQFDCHWTFARLVQPDKPSWNLEPWRPVVTASQMVDARCNPGGGESAER